MKSRKHLGPAFALLGAIMLTFSACGSGKSSKEKTGSSDDASNTASTTTSATTASTVTTTTTTTSTTTALPPIVDISDVLDKTEYDGVYKIDTADFGLDPEKYHVGRMELYDSKILMIINDEELNNHLALYDILSQEMLFNIKLENGVDCFGFTSQGDIFCKDYADEQDDSTLCFYDYDGKAIKTFDKLSNYAVSYCDGDNNVWICSSANGDYTKLTSDGSRGDYTIDKLKNSYANLITIKDDVLYFGIRTERSEIFTYDTKTGTYHTEFEYTGYNFTNGSLYFYDYLSEDNIFEFSIDLENFYTVEFDTDKYAYHRVSDEYVIFDFSTYIRFLNTEDSTYSDVQLINGTGDLCYYEMSFSDDAMILTVNSDIDMDIYYVDFDRLKYENTEMTKVVLDVDAQTLKNIERAEEISKKYGISINPIPYKKGENIDAAGSYVARTDITPQRMSEILDFVEKELADYPEELFSSITRNNIFEFRFCFAGGIISSGAENTISSAGALTLDGGNVLSIAFNESMLFDFDQTLMHEFMHIIEYAIEADYPGSEPFADWYTLNPSDFTYDTGYSDSYVNDTEYVYIYAPIDDTWFVEAYSTTQPMEDRATLFEAMISPGELDVFDSPHIVKKAEFLSDTLQDYYPEWYADGEPIWHNYKYN